jgi:hypothetical protein
LQKNVEYLLKPFTFILLSLVLESQRGNRGRI